LLDAQALTKGKEREPEIRGGGDDGNVREGKMKKKH